MLSEQKTDVSTTAQASELSPYSPVAAHGTSVFIHRLGAETSRETFRSASQLLVIFHVTFH